MIEIRITKDAALNLLLEKMKSELKLRKANNIVPTYQKLELLSLRNLMKIIETSIFDIIILMPTDLLTSDTNLAQIISGTVIALSRVLNREELQLYSSKKAQKLIGPAIYYVEKSLQTRSFSNN